METGISKHLFIGDELDFVTSFLQSLPGANDGDSVGIFVGSRHSDLGSRGEL